MIRIMTVSGKMLFWQPGDSDPFVAKRGRYGEVIRKSKLSFVMPRELANGRRHDAAHYAYWHK